MDGILLSARLLLAAVFLVAGLGKLADRDGAREATHAFGVPEALAGPASTLLIIAELAAGVLLIPSVTAQAGAALAALLLLTFCAGITRSMLRGEAPDCHCFGQLHSAPAGPKTLRPQRAADRGCDVRARRRHRHERDRVDRAACRAPASSRSCSASSSRSCSSPPPRFALSMLRRHGQLLLRIDALEEALAEHGIVVAEAVPAAPPEGLPVGDPAPAFELPDLRHRRVSLRSLTARQRPVLLAFTDPGCGPCTALLPQLAAWQREHAESLRIALISRGDRDANLAHAREHDLTDVLLQNDREVSERYQVSGTPSAVLIDGDGSIASPVHAGADAIRQLSPRRSMPRCWRSTATSRSRRSPRRISRCDTLDGAEAMLVKRAVRPHRRPVLESDVRLLRADAPRSAGIRAGAARRRPEAAADLDRRPRGEPADGSESPILLDQSFAAGNAFGAEGTPSAVLIDADGRTASPVAVGADAVFALLGAAGDARQAA